MTNVRPYSRVQKKSGAGPKGIGLLLIFCIFFTPILSQSDEVILLKTTPVYELKDGAIEKIGSAMIGQKFTVVDQDPNWVKIMGPQLKGWVLANTVKFKDLNPPDSPEGGVTDPVQDANSPNGNDVGSREPASFQDLQTKLEERARGNQPLGGIALEINNAWSSGYGLGSGLGLIGRIPTDNGNRFELGVQGLFYTFSNAKPMSLIVVGRHALGFGIFEITPEINYVWTQIASTRGSAGSSAPSVGLYGGVKFTRSVLFTLGVRNGFVGAFSPTYHSGLQFVF